LLLRIPIIPDRKKNDYIVGFVGRRNIIYCIWVGGRKPQCVSEFEIGDY